MLRSMLMLNTDDGMLLLSEMGYRQKVDLMKVLIETLNLPDDLMEKYRHLFADIEKTHQLRNTMVHAMAWVKGSFRWRGARKVIPLLCPFTISRYSRLDHLRGNLNAGLSVF